MGKSGAFHVFLPTLTNLEL